MHALDEPSTMNLWIQQSGPISLRHTERKPLPNLNAARGVILGILAGGNFLLWSYILARAVFG